MDKTWILVANRSGARLFERVGRSELVQLQDIPHPEGRLKNQDIDTDAGGRSFDRMGEGRHAMGAQQLPSEHLAEQFAKQLADMLNQGRNANAFTKLALVAGPDFLGELLNKLDSHTADMVSKKVIKNLPELSGEDLLSYLDAD